MTNTHETPQIDDDQEHPPACHFERNGVCSCGDPHTFYGSDRH